MWKGYDITLREDGSFVIIKNGNPYHVPNEGEWMNEWAEIHAYAQTHQEQVKPEMIPELPTLDSASQAG